MTATKTSPLIHEERVRFLVVGCGQAVVAVAAEVCLGSLMSELPVTVRIMRGLAIVFTLFAIHVAATQSLSGYREREVKGDLLMYLLVLSSIIIVSFGNVLSFAIISYADMHDMWKGVTLQSLALCMPFTLPVLIARSILGLQLGLVVAAFETIVNGPPAP